MSVSEKILNRTDTSIKAVRDSHLDVGEQDDLIEMACGARDGTNGLNPEAKLQACAENIANLVFLFIRQAVRKPPPTDSWKDVIIKCRREITVIGLGAFALLAFRPQIAAVVEHILRQ